MENIVQLAEELACRVGTLPSTYLGLPLSLRQNSSRAWEGIEDKFKRRLSAWKRQYISKGRRLTLINSTLSNLPTYLLSLFRMPKSVKGKLEKIQRDFLWGGGYNARKIHIVNWNTVNQGKSKGGLGIQNLDLLNMALLGKWIWRFSTEENSIWKSCICIKYGTTTGVWFTKDPKGSYGVGLWKSIDKKKAC